MSDPQKLVDQNGRPLGPRALKTRERLLQATSTLRLAEPFRFDGQDLFVTSSIGD